VGERKRERERERERVALKYPKLKHPKQRTSTNVSNRFGRCDSSITHLISKLYCHSRGWSLLKHFLMTSLNGTVTLEKMNSITVRIRKDLKLHVTRIRDVSLQQDTIIRKRSQGLTSSRLELCLKFIRCVHNSHTLTTSTEYGFDHHRKSHIFGFLEQKLIVLLITVIPRNTRNTSFCHDTF
jgi:hypothetical protein